jgi:serine protease Do
MNNTEPRPRRLLRALLLALAAAGAGLPALSRAASADDASVESRRSAIVRAVEKVRPAVVSIRTNEIVRGLVEYQWFQFRPEEREREGSLGSGAIFHPDGYVVTNAHVISRASKIIVVVTRADGTEMERPARLVVMDADNDIAIVKMLAPEGGRGEAAYPFVPLGRSDDLMIGETVIAIGNPFRLGLTVTTGVVSALRRSVRPSEAKEKEFKDFIQIDAAINPGNSGGPLLDVNGRLIGVNTAILNRATGAEGIGFAIPADRVRETLGRVFKRRLVSGEWLGFELDAGPEAQAVVREVFAQGPARDSGLKSGDRIITVNGVPTPTLFDYRNAEVSLPGRSTARLGVIRAGSALGEIPVQLQPVPTAELSRTRLGFQANDLDAETSRTLGIPMDSGVVLTTVQADGPAGKVGLRKGDIVYSMSGRRIRSADDLLLFLERIQGGDAIDVKIARAAEDSYGETRLREAAATLIAN